MENVNSHTQILQFSQIVTEQQAVVSNGPTHQWHTNALQQMPQKRHVDCNQKKAPKVTKNVQNLREIRKQ